MKQVLLKMLLLWSHPKPASLSQWKGSIFIENFKSKKITQRYGKVLRRCKLSRVNRQRKDRRLGKLVNQRLLQISALWSIAVRHQLLICNQMARLITKITSKSLLILIFRKSKKVTLHQRQILVLQINKMLSRKEIRVHRQYKRRRMQIWRWNKTHLYQQRHSSLVKNIQTTVREDSGNWLHQTLSWRKTRMKLQHG